MLRHSILIYTFLLSGFKLFCSGEPLPSAKPLSSHAIISQDRYDYNDNILVADFELSELTLNSYRVVLRVEYLNNNAPKECSFNVTTAGPVVKVGATSLRRLFYTNRAVLTWYHQNSESDSRRQPQIMGIDLDQCRSTNLGLKNLQNDPIVDTGMSTGGFYVYLNEPVICQSYGKRCMILFNVNFLNFNTDTKMNVDLNWSNIFVEYTHVGPMLARGFDGSNNYKVELFDWREPTKTVLSLANANPQIEVVSARLTVCYIANPGVDTTVICTEFDKCGQTLFRTETKFDVPVTLIAVKSRFRGEVFLLVGKPTKECSNEKSCWNLMWTRFEDTVNVSTPLYCANAPNRPITSDSIPDTSVFGTEEFACTGDRKDLVLSRFIKQTGEKIHYWYACKQGNQMSYAVNEFQV